MKQRLVVLTDINYGSETDDIESLVRLLLYSNEIDIEGFITVTSCWQKKTPVLKNKELIYKVLEAYEKVHSNLEVHAKGYPKAEDLRKLVYHGIEKFGKEFGDGFGEDSLSDNIGVKQIIQTLERNDTRPIWFSLWGGANTLAQAIYELSCSKNIQEMEMLLSKIRIYAISDQDYAGHWLRNTYGDRLFYLVSPSPGDKKGVKYYYRATWPGIASDKFRHGSKDGIHSGGFKGAAIELVGKKWLKEFIQSQGIYGRAYPQYRYIMEGDTPAYLHLIPNGLNNPEYPEYGGWGGRYKKYIPDKLYTGTNEKYPIWTNVSDTVLGKDKKWHTSAQATIWRWREDFQYDFAARMMWTMTSKFEKANHAPVVKLAHNEKIAAKSCQKIQMSAIGTFDPDGDELTYKWQYYKEAGTYTGDLDIYGDNEINAWFTTPVTDHEVELHIILSVTDRGVPTLTRYRRIIVTVTE